ncbi:MAG: fibronectin type III domain-containing protein [Gemmatimonadaceae bacterium]|nr:fibronectin type III domain-containing protein [Gemmatimonadaceae bacterium]
MNRRHLGFAAGSVAALLLVSCDAPLRAPTEGHIAPRIELVRLDTSKVANVVQPTSVTARVFGTETRSVDLTQSGGNWTGRINGLPEGSYELIIEGRALGQVQYYGRVAGVQVQRGQTSTPTVPYAEAAPALDIPAIPDVSSFTQRIPFATLPAATGYTLQYSTDATFATDPGTTRLFAPSELPALIQVTGPGTWFVRGRATFPRLNADDVPWSNTRQWNVVEAAPVPLPPLVPEQPEVVTGRNLTGAKPSDWYNVDLRAGDSLFVETRARRLTENPSPLDTRVTLFRNDSVTQVAQDDNGAGSDSRLVFVPTNTEVHKLRVDGVAPSTVGHYELTVEIRRLPLAPSALGATVASGTQVDLTWTDNSDNETGFIIERCLGTTCTPAPVDTVPANTVAYSDDALTQDNNYRWRVRALNAVGTSNATAVVAANTFGPAAPTGLAATTVSVTQIDLAWNDIATNETGYEVERCAGAGCDTFTNIATLPAGATSYSNTTGIVYNQTYRYRVRAINNVMASAYSTEEEANTIPPATATGVTATTVSGTRIDLSWTDNATTETGYRIERCTGAGCTTGFAQVADVASNVTSFQDTGVTFGNDYGYRIRAFNAVVSTATSTIVAGNTRAPLAPTTLTATLVNGTRIDLAWTDASIADAPSTGFIIERCSGGGCTGFAAIDTVATTPVSFSDLTVVVGVTYRYQVRATGVAGNSAYTNIATANTLLPDAPTTLSATTISATRIDLAWVDASNNENGFEIQRCTGVGCVGFTPYDTVAADVFNYSDVGATAGADYEYRLRAFNLAGNSGFSNTASANTQLPAAPSTLTAVAVSATQVDLAWTNNTTNATQIEIERCTGAGCADFAPLQTLPPGITAFSDGTVTQGNVYQYQIRATNSSGSSAYAGPATATTQVPTAPATLFSGVTSGTEINLFWTLSTGPNVTSQEILRCTGVGCTNLTVIDTADPADGVYSDITVTPGNDYRYVIRALNVSGTGAPSDTVAANTRTPADPTGLSYSVTTGQVLVTWTDNADNETGFTLERCDLSDCSNIVESYAIPAADSTAFVDASVVANTLYFFRVRAVNNVGPSNYTAAAALATIVANAPTALVTTTQSQTEIALAWLDNSGDENGFVIERCVGAACADFTVLDSLPADVVAYNDTGLSADESYTYRVSAATLFGRSAPTNEATSTTFVPTAPSGLAATTTTETSADLVWTDESNNEAGFSIERCDGVDCTDFTEIATVGADVVVYSDLTLSADTRFTYRVRAFNASGFSGFSALSTVSTQDPPVPTELTLVANPATVQVYWTVGVDPAVGPVVSTIIERCEGVDCLSFAQVGAVLATDPQVFEDATITPGLTYRYRVAHSNFADLSAYTAPVSILVAAPAAPSNAIATTLSGTSIGISWTDPSDNENEFVIERCTGQACVDFAQIGAVPRDSTSYTDDTVAPDLYYAYRVLSNNAVGWSPVSNVTSANTFLPDAPSALVATTFSSTRIDLAWTDNGPFETAFEVERCEGAACSDFVLVGTTGASAVAYTDAGLTAGVLYRYRLRAVNAVGMSAYSGTAQAETNLPADPSDLTAVAASATQVNLAWTDNANNETQYIIERCVGAGCVSFAQIALLGPNNTSYPDGTALADQSYSYRVQALNGNGISGYSNVSSTNTFAPAAPTALSATTINGTQIDLAWTENANNELSISVERCTGAACSDFAEIVSLPPNSASYEDTSVPVDGEYRYRVRAINNVANSAYTAEASANTLRPFSPSNFVATTVSATQINLAWDDNAPNEDLYRIERCEGVSCTDFTTLIDLPPNTNIYEDLSVSEETAYRYRIFGINVSGASDAIPEVEATTLLPGVPASVTAAVISGSQIDISWADAADNEDGYRIEQCSGAGCSSFIEVGTVGPDETFFSSTGLALSTFYSFRVRAYNAAGASAYAPTVLANTFSPVAPSGLGATTVFGDRIDLAWTDVAGNESGYRIERCAGAACSDFVEVATTGENSVSYSDLDLSVGTVYRYRVRAYNGVSASGYSNTGQASTAVPATPTGLAGVATSTTSTSLSWTDDATDETGYRVERCAGAGCSDYTEIATLGADATSYDDAGLPGEEQYRYRVRAIGNGSSFYSTEVTVSTLLPAAPSALTATSASPSEIELAWTDLSDNESGFEIARCAGDGCTPTAVVATVGANVTSYLDEALTPGETYAYRVRAINGAGTSAYSEPPQQAITNVPSIPSALMANTDSDTQISLSWTDNSGDETGFVVERCTGLACTDFAPAATTAADATVYADASLAAATTYRFRIRAENANGVSNPSEVVTISTSVPAQPTSLVATTVSGSQIALTWVDAADNETGYTVERCVGAACSSFSLLTALPAGSQAYSDTGLDPEESFTYRVYASNDAGDSPVSAEATATTITPAAPTDLAATTISATQIDLAWTDNADNEAEYRVERCLGAGCSSYALVATLGADATSYQDMGLADGEDYQYRIYAANAAGVSAFSAEVPASTDFPLPPTALSAVTTSGTQIDISWTDNSGNEDEFIVQRCVGSPCVDDIDFVQVATVAADGTGYSDTDVSVGNEYRYRVQASNLAGVTTFTNVAYANTILPGDPLITTSQAMSTTSIQIAWTADTLATDTEIERCQGIPCGAFAPVTTVTSPTVTYLDESLTPGETYEYRVRHVNAAGTSNYSAAVAVGLIVPIPPSALDGFALSGTQSRLGWTDNSTDETGFTVQRCAGVGCVVFDVTVGTTGADTLRIDDAGLAPGQTYGYRVMASNAIGNSTPSATFYLTMVVPTAASGLSATTLSGSSIGLSWTDNSDNERGFSIERCAGAACLDFSPVATVGPNITTFNNNTGLSLNTTYRYRVRSFNNIGPAAGYTNIAAANTNVPLAATALATQALSGTSVRLTWTDNAITETGYRVFRCETGCGDPLNFTQVADIAPNSVTYDDTGLTYGTSYTYVVRAFNIAGPSLPSNASAVSTGLPVPASSVAKTADRTSVTLRWTDNAPFESGFEVEGCEGAACTDFALLGTTAANASEYTATGLNPASEYRFRVRAVSPDGNGDYSPARLARTPIEVANDAVVNGISDVGGGERHYVFSIPGGQPQLRVMMLGGSGDPDLYLRIGQSPQVLDYFESDTLCAPYIGGTVETCTIANPGAGDWYVMLQGFSAYTNVTFAVIVGNTEFTFTNCTQAGATGPSQAQCNTAYTGTALAGGVTVAGGIQTFTLPFTGRYEITAVGAQGANGNPLFVGGRGASMRGEFEFSQGTQLQLAVGQAGVGQGSNQNGGGGGGSFVVDMSNTPLLVGGGGAGARASSSQNGCDATTVGYGGVGSGESPSNVCAVKTTELGLGGLLTSPYAYGSGGGGFFGNGADDYADWWAAFVGFGGRSWANGLLGGTQALVSGNDAQGGFGAGGAGNGDYGGGGGGGYSGGDGGWVAGGGGSLNTGTNQVNTAAVGVGNGQIIIRYLGPVVP